MSTVRTKVYQGWIRFARQDRALAQTVGKASFNLFSKGAPLDMTTIVGMSGNDAGCHELQHLYKEKMRDLPRYTLIQSWLVALSYPFQIAVITTGGFWAWRVTEHRWLAAAVVFVIAATRYRAVNNIVHECSHFTFSHDKTTNYLVGRLCAAVLFFSFQDYRDSHLTHHMYLGDPEKDEDFRMRQKFGFDEGLTTRVLMRHFMTPLLLRHFPDYFSFRLTHEKNDGEIYAWLKVVLVAACVVLFINYPMETIVLVLAPFLFGFTAINYWTDCVDHAGLINADTSIRQSRNAKVPAWLKPLLFPRNDSYHLVHHLLPGIPARHYPYCHHLLLGDPEYHAVNRETKKAGGGL
jgi:fatty acid desaturase